MVESESQHLQLSVLVPTYNRAETLRETLRHMAEQELDSALYEVVVIDDGSTDHTRAVVEEWTPRAPFRLRYIHQSNHGPGHAYNRALEAAAAAIVLYSADDMLLPRQTLKAHLAMHMAHPAEQVAVLGPIGISPTLDQSVFLRKFNRTIPYYFVGKTEVPYYNFWACNVSAKRQFVLGHGRMWEGIGPGGAVAMQDPELGYQLSKAGLRILYCTDAVAYHHQIMTLDEACRDAYKRGMNFGEFRDRVNQPEIAVVWRVWDVSTVRDHLRIWFGPRRRLVPPGDRNPVLLLGRYVLRGLAFNTLTVTLFWIPLAERAERSPAIARFMHSRVYRGIVTNHFLRGYRKGRTWNRAPAVQPKQA